MNVEEEYVMVTVQVVLVVGESPRVMEENVEEVVAKIWIVWSRTVVA